MVKPFYLIYPQIVSLMNRSAIWRSVLYFLWVKNLTQVSLAETYYDI